MHSIQWTQPWYSFTRAAITHEASRGPGVYALAVPRGEWLLVEEAVDVQLALLKLINEPPSETRALREVVFSTEPLGGPERLARRRQLIEELKPRWSRMAEID